MFKGIPGEQFYQFIASRTSIPQLPLTFPYLHGSSNNTTFPTFDPYTNSSHHQQVPFQANNFLHPLHQVSTPTIKSHAENVEIIQRERLQVLESEDPWSGDEVLALLRIRSSSENWFPEFITWEHVSRKLADLGFKRSAEKCREKFEEESRYFNNINNNNSYNKNNNYRVFGELEELYNGGDGNPHQEVASEHRDKMDKPSQEEERQEAAEEKGGKGEEDDEEKDKVNQEEPKNDQQKPEEDNGRRSVVEKSKGKKRKKSEERFEIFKGFCEGMVQKILAQQEEMHVKLIEDMIRRDEEKVAREEQWKREEMDRINKDLELRAHEQALAGDRQAIIIKFLKKFTSPSGSSVEVPGDRRSQDPGEQFPFSTTIISSPSSVPSPLVLGQNPNTPSQANNNPSKVPESLTLSHQNSSSSPRKFTEPNAPNPLAENQSPQNPTSLEHPNPNSLNTQDDSSAPSQLPTYKMHKISTPNNKEDLGKRWPRDEVLALINIRCKLFSGNEDKEGAAKAPLWERISQGMLELGYKRSAKRCKEKWENINKYFRKTKDLNKKRSVDSRTCPYFHQLNALYNQGTLTTTIEGSNSCLESP